MAQGGPDWSIKVIALDNKGQEIKIDSLVVVKGSNIVRYLRSDNVTNGEIHTGRVDGKSVGDWKWVNPSRCEVVGVRSVA
jgi:hypothetical protein